MKSLATLVVASLTFGHALAAQNCEEKAKTASVMSISKNQFDQLIRAKEVKEGQFQPWEFMVIVGGQRGLNAGYSADQVKALAKMIAQVSLAPDWQHDALITRMYISVACSKGFDEFRLPSLDLKAIAACWNEDDGGDERISVCMSNYLETVK